MPMLDGIRIIDMTTVIFGPYATQMLADLGADVIKVEAPEGDVSRLLGMARTTPDMGSTHLTVNRGKRSIVLDLKKEDDAEAMRRLIASADIFIHNVRAEAINRLGFGYEAAKALKPDIIYVHGTGFGQDGPYKDLQAYDDVIQAATGTASILPRVDGNPRQRYFPSLIADKVAGTYGAQAMLAALVHKLRTGEGQHVEVPMFEAFANFMLTEHLRDATFEPPIGPIGYPRQLDPERQPFPTKDGYISIVPYTDPKIIQLFALMGASDFLKQDAFNTPLKRFLGMTQIYTEIARQTPQRPRQSGWKSLPAKGCPPFPPRICPRWWMIRFKATNFFRMREHPDAGLFREMAPPVRYSSDPDRILGFAPKLGEHGEEIRRELGLDPAG
ncbi:MAG: CoA transferase [Sphingomonadales bacterium]|nr:CoA transferase [Sphingomonadales bacterium]